MSNSKTISTRTLVQLSVLTAIILIMAFTPLGFLKAGVVEITLITIPVVIGAIICGPAAGAFLGGMFGLTSFIQCFGLSIFGTTLFNINPFFTAIVCLVPRILMGWLTGLIFKSLKKVDKTKLISYGAASLSGALLNTVLFMSFLLLFFSNTSYIKEMQGGMNIFAFVVAFVGVNGLVEAIVCFIAGTAIAKLLAQLTLRRT